MSVDSGLGNSNLINDKKGPNGCLGSIGDEKLLRYVGIVTNHYKDPH